MLTIGSLFAGIGGLELGLERTGYFKTIWQVEYDPKSKKEWKDQYAIRVLNKHWPDVPKYGDITKCHGKVAHTDSKGCYNTIRQSNTKTSSRSGQRQWNTTIISNGEGCLPYADLICGGFPCQDISNAGKRAGIEGERSGLWKEFIRIIREVRPKYPLVENVAALTQRGLYAVLADLSESGYDAEWNIVSAASVGAPHLRERIFIVAYSKRSNCTRQCIERQRKEKSGRCSCSEISSSYPNNNGQQCSESISEERRDNDVPDTKCNDTRTTHESGTYKQSDQIKNNRNIFWDDLRDTRKTLGRQWESEPDVGRVAHGVPFRVDRLARLGNAVVPQVAQAVGEMIMQFDKSYNPRSNGRDGAKKGLADQSLPLTDLRDRAPTAQSHEDIS